MAPDDFPDVVSASYFCALFQKNKTVVVESSPQYIYLFWTKRIARLGFHSFSLEFPPRRGDFLARCMYRMQLFEGCTHVMHDRICSRVTIDPRMSTAPGWSTSGFHPQGRFCLRQERQARGAVRCWASRVKDKLHPTTVKAAYGADLVAQSLSKLKQSQSPDVITKQHTPIRTALISRFPQSFDHWPRIPLGMEHRSGS